MIVFARTENIAILYSGCSYLNWQQHSLYERWGWGGSILWASVCGKVMEAEGGFGKEGYETKKGNIRCHAHSLAGSTKPLTGTKAHSFWASCVKHKTLKVIPEVLRTPGEQAPQIPLQQRQETKSERSRCVPKLLGASTDNISIPFQVSHHQPRGEAPEWPLERGGQHLPYQKPGLSLKSVQSDPNQSPYISSFP